MLAWRLIWPRRSEPCLQRGPDLEALLQFYLERGFTLQRRSESFAVVAWANAHLLFLAENPDAARAPRWVGLRIMVDDIHPLWLRALQRQWPIQQPLADRVYGLLDFGMQDPAGFTLRCAQALPSAPPEPSQ